MRGEEGAEVQSETSLRSLIGIRRRLGIYSGAAQGLQLRKRELFCKYLNIKEEETQKTVLSQWSQIIRENSRTKYCLCSIQYLHGA